MVEKNPELIRKFLDASAIGWYTYLYGGDRKAAYALIRKDNPEMTDDKLDAEVAKLQELGMVDSGDAQSRDAFRQRANEIGAEIKELRAKREQLEQEALVSEIPAQTAFSALIAVWDRMDVAMLNEPVPTAGHWNINDIYSPGRAVSHVAVP